MSPLPELSPARKLDRQADKRSVDKFFNDEIPANEKWVWVVSNPDEKIREAFFEEKDVDFRYLVEVYVTGKTGAHEFHNVYNTAKVGLFLELIFDEHSLSKNPDPSRLIKYAVRSEFHRLGDNVEEKYMASIRG